MNVTQHCILMRGPLCLDIYRGLLLTTAYYIYYLLEMYATVKSQFNIILLVKIQSTSANRYFHHRKGVNECTNSTLMPFCLPLLRLQISDYESDAPGGHCSLQLLAKCSSAHYVPQGAHQQREANQRPTVEKAAFTNVNSELKWLKFCREVVQMSTGRVHYF